MPKTPERTLHWSRQCVAASAEMELLRQKILDPSLDPYFIKKTALSHFARQLRSAVDSSLAEGYDDTATYLQHILDDLLARGADAKRH